MPQLSQPKIKASTDAQWREFYSKKCRAQFREIMSMRAQLAAVNKERQKIKEQLIEITAYVGCNCTMRDCIRCETEIFLKALEGTVKE